MKKLTVILFIFVLFISTPAISLHGFCNVPRKGDVKGNLVVIFNGPHNKTTPVFKVKPHWQIRYHTLEPDRHFSIVVHDEYGKYISLAANEIGPKEGLYYQEKGGTYYLDVTADGNWRAEIIQLKIKKKKKTEFEKLCEDASSQIQRIVEMFKKEVAESSYINPVAWEELGNSIDKAKNDSDLVYEMYKSGQHEKATKLVRSLIAMLKQSEMKFKKEKAMRPEETLLNQLGYANKNAVFPQHYTEHETMVSSNILYEIGTMIKLHNPSDTTIAIYKDEALGNITNLFTNGIKAKIIDFKVVPDKTIIYKVLILLKDGSKYTGWISGNIISQ